MCTDDRRRCCKKQNYKDNLDIGVFVFCSINIGRHCPITEKRNERLMPGVYCKKLDTTFQRYGFRFSSHKTVRVHFCKKVRIMLNLCSWLKTLNFQLLQKFLTAFFYHNLTFIPHIKQGHPMIYSVKSLFWETFQLAGNFFQNGIDIYSELKTLENKYC